MTGARTLDGRFALGVRCDPVGCMTSKDFAERLRSRQAVLGYWVMLDAPAATERIALTGYDYVVLDGQHGLIDARGLLDGLMAIDRQLNNTSKERRSV